MNASSLRTAVSVFAVVSVLALTGCGTGSEAPTSSGPATAPLPAPTTTEPVPTETTPAVDPSDTTTWTIDEQGIGPAHIGETFSDVVAGLPAWRVDSGCSWAAFLPAGDRSVSAYFARPSDSEDGGITTVTFEALADTIAPTDAPRTSEGVGLGSTREEVMAAYPDAVVQKPTIADGEFLRVGAQGQSAMYFAIREDAATVSAVTVTEGAEPPYEVCG